MAFATIAQLEMIDRIQNPERARKYSEQQILDCEARNCNGYVVQKAVRYLGFVGDINC